MNKKIWEWGLLILLVFLMRQCFRAQKAGDLAQWGGYFAAITGLCFAYYHGFKYRPMRSFRNSVADVATRSGYLEADKEMLPELVAILRCFPGFNDTGVNVDSLMTREDENGSSSSVDTVSVDRQEYISASSSSRFSCSSLVHMSGDVVDGQVFPSEKEREPRVDPTLVAALRSLRYNWFVRANAILIDFDTREIRGHDFLPSLSHVVVAVPQLRYLFNAG